MHFFNSWKCLFWIFENILLLSLGSTYIQRGDHTEGYEMCGCVCGGGYCGEIRIRVETNTHPYEGKYCLPGGREICVGQYPQYIHYARPHLFFLGGIKGTLAIIIITIGWRNKSIFATRGFFSIWVTFMQMGEILLLQCSINVRGNDLWERLMTADNDTKWGSLMLWIEVR